MLLQCVDCDGCSTIAGLAGALDAERAAGKPTPLPTWHRFKDPRDPLRTLGLRRCVARGCFRVETEALRTKKCAGCIARYCSAGCQARDWKDRHKHVCATAQKTFEDLAGGLGGLSEYLTALGGDVDSARSENAEGARLGGRGGRSGRGGGRRGRGGGRGSTEDPPSGGCPQQ